MDSYIYSTDDRRDNMTPYTKAELHAEIQNYMCAFAECLERVYFNEAGWGLLGLRSDDYPRQGICDLKPEDVDVKRFQITHRLDELYEYGVNGRREVDFVWEPGEDDAVFFSARSGRISIDV